ncbi:AAA family ATPase [Planotetraspora silvatica]|uniref:AAA family ATPase n=2 Tax=Planotetraspora silvatica TaxID=234614 RepID=UPI0031E47D08
MNTAPPPHVHPEGLRPPGSGPDDRDPKTRKKISLWDRAKFLLIFSIIYLVLVWYNVVSFTGIMSFSDALVVTARERPWIFVLMGIEVLRQAHFLISERSAGYHRFWTHKVFGGSDRWSKRRFSDWNRFRMARMLKWLFWLVVLALILGAVLDTSPVLALFKAPQLLWSALPYAAQLAFAFFFIAFQFIGMFWLLSRGGVETYFPDDIKTRFSDVWGQDHVVERVKENIVFLERPDEIEDKGGYVPSGLLLWGPPGTGKTLMAEAVAGETGRPYVFVDPGAFVNMFMGIGILKVKSLFRKLRKLALRYGGVIVFFDEADSLGRRGSLAQQGPQGQGRFGAQAGCHGFSYLSEDVRSMIARQSMNGQQDEGQPARRNRFVMGGNMMGGGGGDPGTLQALLTELSGLKKPRGIVNRHVRRLLGMRPKPPPKYRILVMMATNMPNALDEALLRPGRIDRIYKVGYPSKAGRIRTYEGYFDKVQHQLTEAQIDKLATITPYATGATIKDLVNESLINAIRDGREVIQWSDVVRAKRLKQLGPPENVEYIERERHAVAVHEACHAVVAYRTRHHLEIDLATIEKGADYLGMVSSIKPEDQFTGWRSEYEADVMVSLASLAGERMFFSDDNSSGVSGDLTSATYVTGLMESYWGMGVGVSSLPALQELQIMAGKPVQKPKTGEGGAGSGNEPSSRRDDIVPDMLGERIEHNLVRLLARTEALLRDNRREVLCVAHALETHKTLDGEDVVAVIESTRGPLIDGTIYTSDPFYDEIEAYHVAAAEAHRTHSRVEVELPVPVSRVLELEPAAVTTSTAVAPVGSTQSAVFAPPNAGGNGYVIQPDFVPWNGGPPPAGPAMPPPAAPAARTKSSGLLWALLGGLVVLVVFALLGVAFFNGGQSQAVAPGTLSRTTVLVLVAAFVALAGGIAVAIAVSHAHKAERRRAEQARDLAAERAQLLAAAMDPEVAMRLLGYDGRRGPDNG